MNAGTTDMAVAIVTVAAALVLALRGLRSHAPSRARTLQLALAWVAIIAVLAFVLQKFTA